MMQESLLEENKQATSSILSFASLYHLNKFIPQTLSLPLYLISVYSLQFLLIFLALSPPKSPFRLYIIYFILLIYFLLPLNYGYHFSCTINGVIPLTVITYTWKMLIWLKKCKYSSVKKDKIVGPYYHSLFWWRDSSFTVVNQEGKKTNHSNQKFIENHHTDQNNISGRYLFTRLISFIKFSIILEFWLIFIEYLMPKEIPSTPYPIRIFQYFTTSSSSSASSSTSTTSSSYSDKLLFFQTSLYAFYCVIYVGILYWNMIWIYEFYLLVASCLLYYVQSIKKSSDSIFNHFTNSPSYNKLLNKLKIPQNFSSILEQWLQSFLFNTPPLFSSPHLSCSPSEFWSKRWHLLYRNCFVELGYSPCKRFINQHYPNSLPLKKELAHIIGIFAGFWWSALFHEYMIHSLFGSANGEHFTFFLFHGIVAIGWEILVTILFKKFIKNDQKENKIIHHLKKIVGYILWNLILIFSAPWFAEPYIRAKHYYCYPHFGCDKHVKSI